jgi:GNAT superfamily N-acetyltransferase
LVGVIFFDLNGTLLGGAGGRLNRPHGGRLATPVRRQVMKWKRERAGWGGDVGGANSDSLAASDPSRRSERPSPPEDGDLIWEDHVGIEIAALEAGVITGLPVPVLLSVTCWLRRWRREVAATTVTMSLEDFVLRMSGVRALAFHRRCNAEGASTRRPSPTIAMDHQLTESADVESTQAAVRRGIRNADPPGVGHRDYQPIALTLRRPDETLVGGLYGATMWGWLMIDGLWVAEDVRGQGLGTRLMLAAEARARERGCRGAWLGTFDFQARGFYERLGYLVFAELPDFPAGHAHYHMKKIFSSSASTPGGRTQRSHADSGITPPGHRRHPG